MSVNRSLAACSEAWPLLRLLSNSADWRTDAEIDAIVAQHVTAPVPVFAAHDGMVVDLPLP